MAQRLTWYKVGPETCQEDGCDRKHCARGVCTKHYQWHKARGTLPPRIRERGICRVEGCEKQASSQMRCQRHYDQYRATLNECEVPDCTGGLLYPSTGLCPKHYHRAKRYGLTKVEMAELDRGRPCDICGKPGQHVDHCHMTEVVRGFLCAGCNQGVGLMQDDPDLLIRAAEYLKAAGLPSRRPLAGSEL